jgi:hypothetical protein
MLAEDLAREPDTWAQFAGSSPDGKAAIMGAERQSPGNARWKVENKRFRTALRVVRGCLATAPPQSPATARSAELLQITWMTL